MSLSRKPIRKWIPFDDPNGDYDAKLSKSPEGSFFDVLIKKNGEIVDLVAERLNSGSAGRQKQSSNYVP